MKIPEGFLLGGVSCGIKDKGLDLGLILCKEGALAVGYFTKNVNPSYSVLVSKRHINNVIKAVIVNSGNANCFTHTQGLKDTLKICDVLSKYLGIKRNNILIASTGIIGKRLPFEKIVRSIPYLVKNLKKEPNDFAKSILTTDTFTKVVSIQIKGKKKFNILGIAKGAGMISPSLATMLAFILTDAKLDKNTLNRIASEAVEESFDSISVDGCMSTNDSVFFLSYLKGKNITTVEEKNRFAYALKEVCKKLAKMIVKDAEGATKFVELVIRGASSRQEAKKAVRAISNSLLFKCAVFGKMKNWGRIVSSLGEVGIKVKEDKVKIKSTSFKKKNIRITIDLGKGEAYWKGWFSDITPEYVKINAGYS